MDASAILAILVLLVALVVPIFLLMRTQNAAKGKEVCMHGCTVYAQYILSVFRKSVSCVPPSAPPLLLTSVLLRV